MKPFLTFLGFLALGTHIGCQQEHVYDLVLENVTIYDVISKELIKDQSIYIKEGLITDINQGSKTVLARNKINGQGRIVTPGFVDTHIHLTDVFGDYEKAPLSLKSEPAEVRRVNFGKTYLPHGVTTVAEMGQPEKWLEVTMDWQNNEYADIPKLINTGSAFISDEERTPYISHIELRSPEGASTKVIEYHKQGIGHIKVYWRLKEPEMKTVMKTADSLGIRVFAHLDENVVGMEKAIEMGIRHFEHASSVSSEAFEFNELGFGLMQRMTQFYSDFNCYQTFALERIQYVEEKPSFRSRRENIVQQLINSQSTLSTTMHYFGDFCGRTYFKDSSNGDPALTEKQLTRLNQAFDTYLRYIQKAHEDGLTLRIGTDCRQGGKAFLSEMLLLSASGISTKDIFQIATINGARALGVEKTSSSIQKGKIADLIIFENNPFEDVRNILKEKVVIRKGKIYHQESEYF